MGKKGFNLGQISFMGAFALAVIMSFVVGINEIGYVLIFVFGVIAALVNIKAAESQKMFLWVIGFGVVGLAALANAPILPNLMQPIFGAIGAFFTTVAAVFLLKMGVTMMKD